MKYLYLLLTVVLFAFTNTNAALIKYVAPLAKGDGSGKSAAHAADFLNSGFWSGIHADLKKQSVTVKFLAGDYVRAYTEKPLVLDHIGHSKNLLLLEGDGQNTIFTVPLGYTQKSVLIDVKNSENIQFKNFHFTGNGRLGYALRITSTAGAATRNILVENCSWTDMRGIIYGATGAHQQGTSNITYSNCTFKRVGVDSHSHFMYHAYQASKIKVLNCYFEDCTGDYVRFRANCDEGTVKGSTFVRNENFPVYPFISVPLFNDVDPGDETFATNYEFSGNTFKNTKIAMAFHHYGFNPSGFNYLLSAEEGILLSKGSDEERNNLLLKNFKINLDKVKISDNNYTAVSTYLMMGSFPKYGAVTKGWQGWADISSLIR